MQSFRYFCFISIQILLMRFFKKIHVMFILFDDYIFFSSFLVKKRITAKNPLTPRNIVNLKLPRRFSWE
jgi:hypothetical protein